jgi:hypothetical protein
MTQYDFRWVKSTSASPFWGLSDLDISIYSDSVTSQRETTILCGRKSTPSNTLIPGLGVFVLLFYIVSTLHRRKTLLDSKIVHSITVLYIGDFYSEIVFDIWLLETTQFYLIFITKDWPLLKKFIQGQKGKKDQKRISKARTSKNHWFHQYSM